MPLDPLGVTQTSITFQSWAIFFHDAIILKGVTL